eukprot:361882-Prorocentrum_minimum.AAC.1
MRQHPLHLLPRGPAKGAGGARDRVLPGQAPLTPNMPPHSSPRSCAITSDFDTHQALLTPSDPVLNDSRIRHTSTC